MHISISLIHYERLKMKSLGLGNNSVVAQSIQIAAQRLAFGSEAVETYYFT
jgi:hypothetical protein